MNKRYFNEFVRPKIIGSILIILVVVLFGLLILYVIENAIQNSDNKVKSQSEIKV